MLILIPSLLYQQKTVQPSVDAMLKTVQDCSQNQALKDSSGKASVNPSLTGVSLVNSSLKHVSSLEADWKAGDMESSFTNESNAKVSRSGRLVKSQSLGSALYLEGRSSANNDAEDETDPGVSCDDGSHDHNESVVPNGSRDQGESSPEQFQPTPTSDYCLGSSGMDRMVNNDSIFSIGEPLQSEKDGHENCDTPPSGEFTADSVDHTPRTTQGLVKSRSFANITASTPTTRGNSPINPLAMHSRSFNDLHALGMRQKGIAEDEAEMQEMQEPERDDGYDSCNYSGSAKDWIMPATDEISSEKNLQGESSVQSWDELPSRDFKIKRIEDWVNNLQHSSPLEETNELPQSNDQVKRDTNDSNGLTAAKTDGKVTPGMEAAKRYISSLTAAATTAQLANHGLVVIPFLSAFVNLRVVNLSGNSIGLYLLLLCSVLIFVIDLSRYGVCALSSH